MSTDRRPTQYHTLVRLLATLSPETKIYPPQHSQWPVCSAVRQGVDFIAQYIHLVKELALFSHQRFPCSQQKNSISQIFEASGYRRCSYWRPPPSRSNSMKVAKANVWDR